MVAAPSSPRPLSECLLEQIETDSFSFGPVLRDERLLGMVLKLELPFAKVLPLFFRGKAEHLEAWK